MCVLREIKKRKETKAYCTVYIGVSIYENATVYCKCPIFIKHSVYLQ